MKTNRMTLNPIGSDSMKKLIIEIPADVNDTTYQLEDGDFTAIQKLAETSSLYIEFGAPHSNPEYADMGVAECFAIDVTEFTCKIEDDDLVNKEILSEKTIDK